MNYENPNIEIEEDDILGVNTEVEEIGKEEEETEEKIGNILED